MTYPSAERRVLAVDPTHRGFGYVIFEGPRLIDWGTRRLGGNKNKASLRAVSELISLYQPQILVLENVSLKTCRRRKRVRALFDALDELGRMRGLSVRRVSQASAKKNLCVVNKTRLAASIAVRFPELSSCVPPERKPWMSEDPRTAIFDAAGLALAFFEIR